MTRGGKSVGLARFATAEEAALCVARTPDGGAGGGGGAPTCSADERRGAGAGADGEADAARGRNHGRLLRREPPQGSASALPTSQPGRRSWLTE